MAILTESDRKRFSKNPHILKVTNNFIVFTSEFKILAVRQHLLGLTPTEIFSNAGIELVMFADDYAKNTLKRWRSVFRARGEDGLKNSLQGKMAKGRPRRRFDPDDLASIKARLAYLEEENNFLKKLRALEDQYRKKHGLN